MPDINLNKIIPNEFNPRVTFDEQGMNELINSIKQVGIIEPIIVRSIPDGKYELVVGERRFRAAKQAGLKDIPAVIRDYADDEVIELNLIENSQRQDLSYVEKGQCAMNLLKMFPDKFPNKDALARTIGVSPTTIQSWIQSAEVVPAAVQQMIAPADPMSGKVPKGKISGDIAVDISRKVKDKSAQIELAQEITTRGIRWSQARTLINEVAKNPGKTIKDVIKHTIEEAPVLLPFSKKHSEDILKKQKTQTTRKGVNPNIRPGMTVRAAVTHFADLKIEDVYRKKLGEFDENDAQREGGYTLEEFQKVWVKLHNTWNPNETVSVIKFNIEKVVEDT